MNRRNKEYSEEVRHLLVEVILAKAEVDARAKHLSPYDVEIELEWALNYHKTYRMIATDMAVQRHFENLTGRNLFIFSGDRDDEKIKLNPQFAGKEVDLLICRVRMPENKVI